ncbi:hypothetical protein AOLI_G00025260 [Acnodon oligacanthus]
MNNSVLLAADSVTGGSLSPNAVSSFPPPDPLCWPASEESGGSVLAAETSANESMTAALKVDGRIKTPTRMGTLSGIEASGSYQHLCKETRVTLEQDATRPHPLDLLPTTRYHE